MEKSMASNQASSSDLALLNLENLLPELEALYKDVHSQAGAANDKANNH